MSTYIIDIDETPDVPRVTPLPSLDEDDVDDPFISGLLAKWESEKHAILHPVILPRAPEPSAKSSIIVYDISDDSEEEKDLPQKKPTKKVPSVTPRPSPSTSTSPSPSTNTSTSTSPSPSPSTSPKKRSRQSVADYYYNLFNNQPKIVKCVETEEQIKKRKNQSMERENLRRMELEKERLDAIQRDAFLVEEKEIKRNMYYGRIGIQFKK